MESPDIEKVLSELAKKVEALENQSFAQKLLIDELENKLSSAEEMIRKMQEDPFGIGKLTTVPYSAPHSYKQNHVCTPGQLDWTGGSHCTICGAYLAPSSWTVTCNTDNMTYLPIGNIASDLSSDVKLTLEDIPCVSSIDTLTK